MHVIVTHHYLEINIKYLLLYSRKHMKQGVTAWLDVPLEALAKRIAAVGTASRPLLHQEPGDPYTKVYIMDVN